MMSDTDACALRRIGVLLLTIGVIWATAGSVRTWAQEASWEATEILTGASPADMDLFMRAINASLGTDCTLCHDGELWHLETKPQKQAAREMMRMVADMSENSFEVLDVPTCWTCHRGNAVPAAMPIPVPAASYDPGIFSSSREPARQVYENVQQYVTIPAEGLAEVMEGYSAALGVGCDYCHTPDFASDELVTKVLSRRMFEIQREVQAEFFEMGPDLTCWTCHQGAAVPELNLPPDLVPIP